MFVSRMDSGREAGGGVAAGTVLMRFVWPHGGRSVLITGSFNGWGELVAMAPVEGCPRVFQAICSITPGYHLYKFYVDGEWRYDEHQSWVTSEYGLVNTLLFPMDANCNPTMGSELHANMELDNEHFRRVVHVSDGTLNEVSPTISEADVQASRHRISVFLSTQTAYELLPKSGKLDVFKLLSLHIISRCSLQVVALDVDLPVKQAFHILYEQVNDFSFLVFQLIVEIKI
ncbi:unnamed protein product [Linum tenue]|uniref:AMP-activated protein kinase glycogen-binding domain-containing protein n=1 Tax=Linum tenue TaxID=586396 RepID=A0AAV0S140_9ROSI|nr:unnamed protein product [Linum tenue]